MLARKKLTHASNIEHTFTAYTFSKKYKSMGYNANIKLQLATQKNYEQNG